MMKSEFENLAGRAVTDEQYRAIEILYMSSNLEKAEFVKSMRPMLKNIPQPEKKKDIKRMVVRDHSGFRKTPNGCYYHIEYVELEGGAMALIKSVKTVKGTKSNGEIQHNDEPEQDDEEVQG